MMCSSLLRGVGGVDPALPRGGLAETRINPSLGLCNRIHAVEGFCTPIRGQSLPSGVLNEASYVT